MTSENIGAKEFSEDNSIIDSEVAEVAEGEDATTTEAVLVDEQSVSNNGTISERVETQTLNENSATENYDSEEFEEEKSVEESVESDNEEIEDGDELLLAEDGEEAASTGCESSDSSIRIRCEINISSSAVKTDPEEDEDATVTGPAGTENNNRRKSDDKSQFTMDDEIRSWTPSDCNETSHLFDMKILHESMVNLLVLEEERKRHRQQQQAKLRYKNGTRMSLSFTNERMREIERHNQILVRKIFSQSASPQVTVSVQVLLGQLNYLSLNILSRTSGWLKAPHVDFLIAN